MRRLLLAALLLPAAAPADTPRTDVAALLRVAGDRLAEQLRHAHPGLTRVETMPVGLTPRLPADADDAVPRVTPDSGLSRRARVWLDIRRRGQPVASIPVWFEVRAYRMAAVVSRPLRPKEAMRAGDITVQEREVAGLGDVLTSDRLDPEMRARRYLRAGQVLRSTDLEPQPPVVATQPVTVRVLSGSIVIETTGIAEQEGRVGDTIRVRNPNSEASFLAQVTNASQVEVVDR